MSKNMIRVLGAIALVLAACGQPVTPCSTDKDCPIKGQTCDIPAGGMCKDGPTTGGDMMSGGNSCSTDADCTTKALPICGPAKVCVANGNPNMPPMPTCTMDSQCLPGNQCKDGACTPTPTGGATKKYVVYFPGQPAGSFVNRRECYGSPAVKGSDKVGDVKPWPGSGIAWKSLGNPKIDSTTEFTSAYVEIYEGDDLRVQCTDAMVSGPNTMEVGYGFNALAGTLTPNPADTGWVWRVGTAAGTKVPTKRVYNLNKGINGQTAD